MKDRVLHKGRVSESLPATMFRVELEDGGKIVLCALSGRMFTNHIRVIPGDMVEVALSPDGARGRIEKRYKN